MKSPAGGREFKTPRLARPSFFRLRLLLLVLLTGLPSVGLMIHSGLEIRRSAIADVEQEALQVLRLTVASHDRLLEATH